MVPAAARELLNGSATGLQALPRTLQHGECDKQGCRGADTVAQLEPSQAAMTRRLEPLRSSHSIKMTCPLPPYQCCRSPG